MSDLQIEVSYTGKNGEIAVISPKGYVDSITVKNLEEKIDSQIAMEKFKLIVDMKKISYVNSSGWGVFLREIKGIRDKKGDLVLANMSADVYDVYEKMEFSTILKSFDNLKAAIDSFSA